MFVLGIDTSSEQSSVALLCRGEVIAENQANNSNKPSLHLLPMISELLNKAEVPVAKIDRLAGSRGPGSFTGLRTGLGTLLGLSDALDKPIYGFDSFDCIAKAMGNWGRCLLAPTSKARKGFFYLATFNYCDGPKRRTKDVEVRPSGLCEFINEPVIFVGDGFKGMEGEIRKSTPHNVQFLRSIRSGPAVGAAMLANEIIGTANLVDHNPNPKYVGRPQAEINFENASIPNKGDDDDR
jgi:tRNA threonylcarbamoyladenosine biosynthesis protein TsaB